MHSTVALVDGMTRQIESQVDAYSEFQVDQIMTATQWDEVLHDLC